MYRMLCLFAQAPRPETRACSELSPPFISRITCRAPRRCPPSRVESISRRLARSRTALTDELKGAPVQETPHQHHSYAWHLLPDGKCHGNRRRARARGRAHGRAPRTSTQGGAPWVDGAGAVAGIVACSSPTEPSVFSESDSATHDWAAALDSHLNRWAARPDRATAL